jgi:hypothetical protein
MKHEIPLAALLDRLAEESSGLAACAARAEVGLQTVLDLVAELPAGAAADLQRLDLVRQTLEDFSRLLWVAAAAAAPPHDELVATMDLDAAATLTDLRVRLAGDTFPDRIPQASLLDDLHLF